VINPETGEEETFNGWVDPNYVPAPGSTPYPACWLDSFATAAPSGGASASPGASAAPSASPAASASPEASASAEPSGSPAASGSPEASGSPAASGSPGASAPAGAVLNESAASIAYEVGALTAPADAPFQIVFQNKDAGVPHNINIKDAGGTSVFKGDIFPGLATMDYNVGPLPAGSYTFVCDVHSNMTGTLTAG
jgi:plastocyanin